jgi:hypothetical protein
MLEIRTMLTGTAVAGLLTAGLALGAPAAQASGPGSCVAGNGATGTGGDGCMWYHPDQVGGYYGNPYSINFQGHTFGGCNKGSCDGDGQQVRNNAASVSNWDYACTLIVWVYPLGTSGNISQSFAPWSAGNLNTTLRNNEASQTWSGPGAC